MFNISFYNFHCDFASLTYISNYVFSCLYTLPLEHNASLQLKTCIKVYLSCVHEVAKLDTVCIP